MEISKILMATIVAATLMSQTHSALLHSSSTPSTLQTLVTYVIPQKTANATQRVRMSYLVRFIPRLSFSVKGHQVYPSLQKLTKHICSTGFCKTKTKQKTNKQKNKQQQQKKNTVVQSFLAEEIFKFFLKVLFFPVWESELRLLVISFFCSSTVTLSPSPMKPPFLNYD